MNGTMLILLAAALAPPQGFHVKREIAIGGEGGWDYVTVDAAARRLYASHATKVVVVDLNTGKVAGEIPNTAGVHGVALAPRLNRGFTSNGRANSVTIFDLKTLAAIGTVVTGENPDAILFEPVSGRVFTFNGRSKDATAFAAATGRIAATIPLGGKPEFAVTDGAGSIWVNIEDTSEVVQIDGKALKVAKRYSIKPCEEPSGLALDVKGRRLFSVCANRIMAISDPEAGRVVSTLPTGGRTDGAGFDAVTRTAFSSNGEGTLTVVQETAGEWKVVENVPTLRSARTMAVDPVTHEVYLPAAAAPGEFKILVIGR